MTVEPNDASLKRVIWSSDNTDIVALYNDGLISGVADGTATITATTVDGSFTATCVVTVGSEIDVTGVSIEPSTAVIKKGEGISLTPVITPENATNKEVTWHSQNIYIATVSDNGYVQGVAAGNVNIIATTVDGSFMATCEVTVYEGIYENGFIFDTSTKTITGYLGSETDVVIPSKIGGYDVENIGENAFYNKDITSVSIPNSVLTIGREAFYECQNLTSVTFEENAQISEIGAYAFYNCNNLANLIIPDSVTTIGENAFGRSGLSSIDISANVISIGPGAFANCQQLTDINVDNENGVYCSTEGILYSKDMTTLYQYPIGKSETSFVVPNGILNIGAQAFIGSTYIEVVTLPEGLLNIGNSAFGGVGKMVNITIPASVTSIDFGAFTECSSLSAITVSGDNQIYTDVDGILYSKAITELIAYPFGKTDTAFAVPDSVEVIKNGAFYLHNFIKSVSFSDTSQLTVIERNAFIFCNSIETLVLPNSPITIGDTAFYRCNSLT